MFTHYLTVWSAPRVLNQELTLREAARQDSNRYVCDMSSFQPGTYQGLITERAKAQDRLVSEYGGNAYDGNNVFDVVIIGSGMGGGLLADAVVEQGQRRVLVLEAGSYLLPTHVYNVCRFPNASVAGRFAVKTFEQSTDWDDAQYIHERPQLNLGGRSVFWSGLIPQLQPWEMGFFPEAVRADLSWRLDVAGQKMNASKTMGAKARHIVEALRRSPLATHFEILETPRALHQPYLTSAGAPRGEYWDEPTGVFNTAELLINQLEYRPPVDGTHGPKQAGLNLLLNHYTERIERQSDGRLVVHATDVLQDKVRSFVADSVVLAAGSIGSPKILSRSPVRDEMTPANRDLIGMGLTDHPTSGQITGGFTHIDGVRIDKNDHAKIIMYSRGHRDATGVIYPFNVEININHEWWHLRENDPDDAHKPDHGSNIGPPHLSRLDVKYSFGNCLDDTNRIVFDGSYTPPILHGNLRFASAGRFNALAEWNLSFDEVTWKIDQLTHQIYSMFGRDGGAAQPTSWFGDWEDKHVFGTGTVHHAVGTMRMPWKKQINTNQFESASVVDTDLMVRDCPGLYACDMSVMPFSSAANPVRTLAALALRLAERL